MNSAFVGYEELSRCQRVLSTLVSVDNTLLDLLNSSYPTQPHSLIAKYIFSFLSFFLFFFLKTRLITCACVAILYFHTLSILLHFLNFIILGETSSLELF